MPASARTRTSEYHHLLLSSSPSALLLLHGNDPFLAKLSHLNLHPLELVRRYRDPQVQVGENYSYLLMFKRAFHFNISDLIC